MSGSESTKKKGLEHVKDLAQKLYEIGTKSFQSVSDVLNELTEELSLEAAKAVNIDSTNGKLTVVVKTQKATKTTRLEMELTLQSSESQPKGKEDSPQGMYRVDKIRYTKHTRLQRSILEDLLLHVIVLVIILVILWLATIAISHGAR